MTKIGYIRVSSFDQNFDRQIELMNNSRIETIFKEKSNGKDINRPEFQKMLEFVRTGDEIYVTSLDCLGINYDDIKETVVYLKNKKVSLTILDAQFLNFNTGNDLLDTAMLDMFLSLLSYIAENERAKILERQRQGIEHARRSSRYKGRTPSYTKNSGNPQKRLVYQEIVRMLKDDIAVTIIAKENGVSRPTVYKIKKEVGL